MRPLDFPITLTAAAKALYLTPTEVSIAVRLLEIPVRPGGTNRSTLLLDEAGYRQLEVAADRLRSRDKRIARVADRDAREHLAELSRVRHVSTEGKP